jgi:hypothetical protein
VERSWCGHRSGTARSCLYRLRDDSERFLVFTDVCRASRLVRIGPRSIADLLLINESSHRAVRAGISGSECVTRHPDVGK